MRRVERKKSECNNRSTYQRKDLDHAPFYIPPLGASTKFLSYENECADISLHSPGFINNTQTTLGMRKSQATSTDPFMKFTFGDR